jgi:hypothetical protein
MHDSDPDRLGYSRERRPECGAVVSVWQPQLLVTLTGPAELLGDPCIGRVIGDRAQMHGALCLCNCASRTSSFALPATKQQRHRAQALACHA